MANQLVDAQNNFSNWENVYQKVRQNHERLIPETEEFGRGGVNDSNGSVNPSGILINIEHGKMGASMESSLTAALRTFDGYLEEESNLSANTLLERLFEKNSADEEDVQLKSRGTVYGASAADAGNVGDGVLYVCSKDVNDDVVESATIETLTFRATAASSNKRSLGLEPFSVKGVGTAGRTEFTAGGRGTRLGGSSPIGAGRSNLLKNASFDLAFAGSGADKVQGWDFEGSTEGNVTRDTTNVAEDRGSNGHASLAATGNFVMRFYFRKRSVGLNYLAPFITGLRWLADGANGTVGIILGSAGNVAYTNTVVTSDVSGAWQTLTIDPDDVNAWRKNFDTNGNPYLEINVTSYAASTIYIDDVFLEQLESIGGRWVKIVSGVVPTVEGDKFTQACTLTTGAGLVELDSGASGSVDGITADGVALMDAVVAFDTSLAITAQAVVDNINDHTTYPNYVASRTGDDIVITQEFPVAGTIVIVSASTTIATTDTNVTGGSIGTKQDSIVRRKGLYLPHAASASTGWGDHA